MAGRATLRVSMQRAERAAGCGAYSVRELFLQGVLASAAKEAPVLASALVFLLKTSSVILHLAPPPAQGRAAVCGCD